MDLIFSILLTASDEGKGEKEAPDSAQLHFHSTVIYSNIIVLRVH